MIRVANSTNDTASCETSTLLCTCSSTHTYQYIYLCSIPITPHYFCYDGDTLIPHGGWMTKLVLSDLPGYHYQTAAHSLLSSPCVQWALKQPLLLLPIGWDLTSRPTGFLLSVCSGGLIHSAVAKIQLDSLFSAVVEISPPRITATVCVYMVYACMCPSPTHHCMLYVLALNVRT